MFIFLDIVFNFYIENRSNYPYMKQYYKNYKTLISDMKLSYHEKILAVALAPNSDENPKIEM